MRVQSSNFKWWSQTPNPHFLTQNLECFPDPSLCSRSPTFLCIVHSPSSGSSKRRVSQSFLFSFIIVSLRSVPRFLSFPNHTSLLPQLNFNIMNMLYISVTVCISTLYIKMSKFFHLL